MTIEFGLKLPDHLDIVTFARQAESMHVDYAFQGEHVFFHGPVSNSLIDLSFAAAATERLKLLSSVTLIPLYPAVLLAKMVASLAVNSRGRFNLGVGVGGEFPAEFEACGVSTTGRGRATDAALDLMMGLWRGEPIGPFESSSGKTLSLDPLPPGLGGRAQLGNDRPGRSDWRLVDAVLVQPGQVSTRSDAARGTVERGRASMPEGGASRLCRPWQYQAGGDLLRKSHAEHGVQHVIRRRND